MAEIVGFEFKFYQKLEGAKKAQIKVETVERLGKHFGLEPWQLLAPPVVFSRVRVKIPISQTKAVRGPRAKWKGQTKI